MEVINDFSLKALEIMENGFTWYELKDIFGIPCLACRKYLKSKTSVGRVGSLLQNLIKPETID